jgi:hypothetical protein
VYLEKLIATELNKKFPTLNRKSRGTIVWKDEMLGNRLWNIDAQIGIRRIAGFKNKE